MAHTENDEFARIALEEGFCTREQIERCLRIQSRSDERLSLGQSLLREGFLTEEQYSWILVLLRQGAKKERKAELSAAVALASARQGQEDRVLGGILVSEGWISAELLKVGMEEAARSGRPLAEALKALGLLDPARVAEILRRLERTERSCPSCGATLSIVRLPTAHPIRCPRCGSIVAPGRP